MRNGVLAGAAALAAAGCSGERSGITEAAPEGFEIAWTAEGFSAPESVAPSEDGAVFYVSNVAGQGAEKDGEGWISKLSPDGEILELRWVEGLDAPKGMAATPGRLWVSDIDRVVEIDTAAGAVVAAHAVEGAEFLNDVEALPGGLVLASDSGAGRIMALSDGTAELWLEDPLLERVNGLLAREDDLLVATMQGRLLSVSLADRAITQLADGLGDADGVVLRDDGGFVVSNWRGWLYGVSPSGAVEAWLDTSELNIGMNDLTRDGDRIYVANWGPGTVTAFNLP